MSNEPSFRCNNHQVGLKRTTQARGIRCVYAVIALAVALIMLLPAAGVFAAEERDDVGVMKNFGGAGLDEFVSVAPAPGGFVAVGNVSRESFGNGDWAGVKPKGLVDAVIVRIDTNGNVKWKRNFGGSDHDYFNHVTAVSDGFVVVGYSYADTFGSGDWSNIKRKGISDATIVKYNSDGQVVWKRNFGGSDVNVFTSVTAVSDGYIAVGYTFKDSFGNADWTGVTGNGGTEAVMVKYSTSGNVMWKKIFGGPGHDHFLSVSATSGGGVIAAGCSSSASFVGGDWLGVTAKGDVDAIIVEFDKNGNALWKKNFGGKGYTVYYSVITLSDGFAAAGFSSSTSFGNGNLSGITAKGESDALLVKYEKEGTLAWEKSFDGSAADAFYTVIESAGGFAAVGYSFAGSFDNGDWSGVQGKGIFDGIMVRFNANGDVVSKDNIGGTGANVLTSLIAVPGGLIAVGSSAEDSFGSADWIGNEGKGGPDALYVRYFAFVPVNDILKVPTTASVGRPLTLTGTVSPKDATENTITWRVVDAGTTGATISGHTLSATEMGTVVVEATIADGVGSGVPYTQTFTITVTETRTSDPGGGSSMMLAFGVIAVLVAAGAGGLWMFGKRSHP